MASNVVLITCTFFRACPVIPWFFACLHFYANASLYWYTNPPNPNYKEAWTKQMLWFVSWSLSWLRTDWWIDDYVRMYVPSWMGQILIGSRRRKTTSSCSGWDLTDYFTEESPQKGNILCSLLRQTMTLIIAIIMIMISMIILMITTWHDNLQFLRLATHRDHRSGRSTSSLVL